MTHTRLVGSWYGVGEVLHFFRYGSDGHGYSLCDAVKDSAVDAYPTGVTCDYCLARLLPESLGEVAPSSVLTEAGATVLDRQEGYGSPYDNHGRTARIWSAMLGIEVTARMVCLLNIAQKVSRDTNAPKRDNLVDIAGYARCAEMVTPSDPSTP